LINVVKPGKIQVEDPRVVGEGVLLFLSNMRQNALKKAATALVAAFAVGDAQLSACTADLS
jgi:hypothetical protein